MMELAKRPNCRVFADWAGGLIWISHPSGLDGGAEVIRKMVADIGGARHPCFSARKYESQSRCVPATTSTFV